MQQNSGVSLSLSLSFSLSLSALFRHSLLVYSPHGVTILSLLSCSHSLLVYSPHGVTILSLLSCSHSLLVYSPHGVTILSLLSCSHSLLVYSPHGVTILSLLSSTVLFTMIWLPTNYMYSRALLTIPPTDVTALFSTAPVFVFLLSIVILREPPLILRVSECVCECV